MKNQTFNDVFLHYDCNDFIIHDAHTGFREDYFVLQSLIRKYKPKTIMEIGTNIGSGIICMHSAYPDARIFSLDLDYETMRKNSDQYPLDSDGSDRVGSAAKDIPYTQLRGDSMTFDYSKYPCDAWYIDGQHDEIHAYHESCEAIKQGAKLIIWHDSDMPEVMAGIKDAISETKDYQLFRVVDTRIAYALKV